MTVRRLIMISAVMAVAACNQPAPTNEVAANTTAPEPGLSVGNTTEPPISDDAAINAERYAKCAVTMLTMSRIYTVLAEMDKKGKRDELAADAAKRKDVAKLFYQMAIDNAEKSGHTKAEVEAIGNQLQESYDKTRETKPFDVFAGQVAEDADRCQELARTAT